MPQPARILIVTNGHLCRNPRPLKEASALGRAGYDVTVLGVRNHLASAAVDADLLRTAPFRCETIDVMPGFGRDSAAVVFARRLNQWFARWAAQRLRWPTMAALGPAGPLLAGARRHGADLTIVHNEVPHWVGTKLLAQGRRVAADIEDWHSEDLLPAERAGRPLAKIRAVEATLLRTAAYTTTTSHALAEALQSRYGGRRPRVISNAFPLQPTPAVADRSDPPAFFWFSQTLGPGRGLESFLDAWGRTLQPSRLVLLGEPRSGYADHLRARLPATHRSRLSFLPLVPPAELPALIARHDLGLALEQAFIPNRDLTITNKILQYLNAGLGVIATDTQGQREVLARAPAAGITVKLADAPAVASALDALLADRARVAAMGQAARRLAETTYCWEREEPALLAAVAEALATRP